MHVFHTDIGEDHDDDKRGRVRGDGYAKTLGLGAIEYTPFAPVAKAVRDAYSARPAIPHTRWAYLRGRVEEFYVLGAAGIYAIKSDPIEVYMHDGKHYLFSGNHRALALFILGEKTLEATSKPWPDDRSEPA